MPLWKRLKLYAIRDSSISRMLNFLKDEEMQDYIDILDHGKYLLNKDLDLKTILDQNRKFRFEIDQIKTKIDPNVLQEMHGPNPLKFIDFDDIKKK